MSHGAGRPRPIAADDDIASFDCGQPSLNNYLHKRALANHSSGASRCHVSVHEGRVVGYFALAAASAQHVDVRAKVRRNMPDPIPALLLSRLAVDAKFQSRGLGRDLLFEALNLTLQAAELVGVRVLLVHALNDEARNFYEKYDFGPSLTDPMHLMLLMQDVPAIAWPNGVAPY